MYVVDPIVVVLIVAGFQVPVIPLVEVACNAGAVAFWHRGPICVNAGVSAALITTDVVAVTAGQPPLAAIVYVTV